MGRWLDRQRGLAPVTVHNYCWNVEQFLKALPQPTQASVSLLDAGAVIAFMVEFCRDRNTNSAKSMARSVRSFLRFAHATGRVSAELWGAVPVSAGWHLAALPTWCGPQILSVFWRSQRVHDARPPTAATM